MAFEKVRVAYYKNLNVKVEVNYGIIILTSIIVVPGMPNINGKVNRSRPAALNRVVDQK